MKMFNIRRWGQKILAFLLCITISFSAPAAAGAEDFLLQLFLLMLLDEYGLTDVIDLLDLFDAESVEELYDLYNAGGLKQRNTGGPVTYDENGYAVYQAAQSGILYGVYEDGWAYITGYNGSPGGTLHIPAYVDGYPVYDVEEYAFQNAQGLGHVVVEEGVERISAGAFQGSDVVSLTLPSTLTEISDEAFLDCTALQEVVFARGLKSIGVCAFQNCVSLEQVILPDSVEKVDFDAFLGCTALTKAHLGAGLSEMTGNPFSECVRLTDLTVAADNITFEVRDGLLINIRKNALVRYPGPERNESYFLVPNGIAAIDDSCFGDLNHLKDIILPPSVTTIGDFAFWGCTELERLNLGNSVQSIGYGAIPINQMKGIVLPDSITFMDDMALCIREGAPSIPFEGVMAGASTPAAIWAAQNGYRVLPVTGENLTGIGMAPQDEGKNDAQDALTASTDYAYEGETVIFRYSAPGDTGTVEFNMQGRVLGRAELVNGTAECAWTADQSGVYTVTAVRGLKSAAVERIVVSREDYMPVVQSVAFPCYHEYAHVTQEPVIREVYREAYDPRNHIRQEMEHPAWVCSRCGMYCMDDPVASRDTEEAHVYGANGVCPCGMDQVRAQTLPVPPTQEPAGQESAFERDFPNRYVLKTNSLYHANEIDFFREGDLVTVSIEDVLTKQIVEDDEFEIRLQDPEGGLTFLAENNYKTEKCSSAEFVLLRSGEEIDRQAIFCTHLEVDPGSSGGNTLSNILLMDDMRSVNWNTQLLAMNERVVIENFIAVKTGGHYKVTFSAYSDTPMMLGVYAYDAYNEIRDKQFINGFWYNTTLVQHGTHIFKGMADIVRGKDTIQLTGDMKTNITLYVPQGGSIRFLTPAQDVDVERLNTFMYLVNLLDAGMGAVVDARGLREIVNGQSQSKVLKAVVAMDKIDIFNLVQKVVGKTAEEYMKAVITPGLLTTFLKCILEVGLTTVFERLESAIFTMLTGGISDAVNFVGSGVGAVECAVLMNQDLQACYEQEDWTRLRVILFPE